MKPNAPQGSVGQAGPQAERSADGGRFRGPWQLGAPYEPKEVVHDNGALWICVHSLPVGASITPPSKSVDFALFMAKPADDTIGKPNPAGPAGAPIPQDVVGPAVAQGSAGPLGATGAVGAADPQGLNGAGFRGFAEFWNPFVARHYFIVPARVTRIMVEAWGGSGGGGGTVILAGCGGGGGGYVRAIFAVTPGDEFKVILGQAGSPGINQAGSSSAGGAGGMTWVGSDRERFCYANGGTGGGVGDANPIPGTGGTAGANNALFALDRVGLPGAFGGALGIPGKGGRAMQGSVESKFGNQSTDWGRGAGGFADPPMQGVYGFAFISW